MYWYYFCFFNLSGNIPVFNIWFIINVIGLISATFIDLTNFEEMPSKPHFMLLDIWHVYMTNNQTFIHLYTSCSLATLPGLPLMVSPHLMLFRTCLNVLRNWMDLYMIDWLKTLFEFCSILSIHTTFDEWIIYSWFTQYVYCMCSTYKYMFLVYYTCNSYTCNTCVEYL